MAVFREACQLSYLDGASFSETSAGVFVIDHAPCCLWIVSRVLSHHCLSTSLLLIQVTRLTVCSRGLATLISSTLQEKGRLLYDSERFFWSRRGSSAKVPAQGLVSATCRLQWKVQRRDETTSSSHPPTPHSSCRMSPRLTVSAPGRNQIEVLLQVRTHLTFTIVLCRLQAASTTSGKSPHIEGD
jgi:hypothetical protein